jgi:4,5-DOPA dioxygenase extradiol
MAPMPSLFVSHGAPTLAIQDSPARRFLQAYGQTLPEPRGILVLSAHFEAAGAVVTATPRPETIYDFWGFPQPLYEIVYTAPGSPALAGNVAQLLENAGIRVRLDTERGLDHGAWVPLSLLYPEARVPVVQLCIDPAAGPEYHLRLGEILRPLRDEGVLLLGSGSVTHNLRELAGADDAAPNWVVAFSEWVAEAIAGRRVKELLAYRKIGPHAQRNHPTEEHFLPLLAALGAAGSGEVGRRVHQSYSYGVLAMDIYAFGPEFMSKGVP